MNLNFNQLRLFKLLSIIFCLIMMSTKPSLATASYSGPTGLITVPTAEAVPYHEIEFSYNHILAKDPHDDFWKYHCNFGMFKNFEVGVVGGKEPKEGMFLNLKYHLTATEERFPLSLALGLKNVSASQNSSLYMVATKKIREDLKIHFGFEALFLKQAVTPVMMGGIDYMLDDSLKLISDVNGDGTDYHVNAAFEYYFSKEIAFRAGIINIGDKNPNKTTYLVGISYQKQL